MQLGRDSRSQASLSGWRRHLVRLAWRTLTGIVALWAVVVPAAAQSAPQTPVPDDDPGAVVIGGAAAAGAFVGAVVATYLMQRMTADSGGELRPASGQGSARRPGKPRPGSDQRQGTHREDRRAGERDGTARQNRDQGRRRREGASGSDRRDDDRSR